MNYRNVKAQAAGHEALDDNVLVDLAHKGQLEAFNALYARYLPTVYRRVRYVIPERDVEDVVQEVFITVLKSLRSFKGNAQFSTWLRTLTNRRVADYYRGRNPAESNLADPLEDDAAQLLPDRRPGSNPASMDESITVRTAIQALPENYQEVLLLRFAEELAFEEIARLQGRSLEATKSLFRRAVAALRSELEESHDPQSHA